MSATFFVAVILGVCGYAYGSYFKDLYPYHEAPLDQDVGEPLYLTPYIDQGNIKEGQEAAKVNLDGFQDTESYSGYITINKTYNSNMFFWYFPSKNNQEKAPVVVWLQGGLGASSLFGLLVENGPFLINEEGNLEERETSWSNEFNMVYIDNPVGAGYSYTESNDTYPRGQVDVGRDLYKFFFQFFKLFSHLQENEFYLVGESYAGKYVPAAAYTIHTNNKNSEFKINLKGLAIGNGWTVPKYMFEYGQYLYQLGLIDDNAKNDFIITEKIIKQYIQNGDLYTANEISTSLIGGENSYFLNVTGLQSYYNYVSDYDISDEFVSLIQSENIRKSIHVGDRTFNKGLEVAHYLNNDTMRSTTQGWMEELLEDYRILFYNGQLDIICAYPLTVNVLKNLKWSGANDYKSAERKVWKVNDSVAGYSKSVKGMTELLVRNAGHLVPKDQPQWAYDLITRFIFNKGF